MTVSDWGPDSPADDPATVVGRASERRLFFRSGMWRGPELTEEQRANLRERVWGGGADDPIPA